MCDECRDIRREIAQCALNDSEVASNFVPQVGVGILAVDQGKDDLLDGSTRALRSRLQGHDIGVDGIVPITNEHISD